MGALLGRRIVVTRRPGQASRLRELFQERGALVLEVPAIEVRAASDPGPLDEALRSLERYQWVVFTSANAVTAVLDRLAALGLAPRLCERGPRLASVGPATTAAVSAAFPEDPVALEPVSDFRAGGLVEAFARQGVGGTRVLLPVSSRGRDALAAGLRALGAVVEVAVAYETVEPEDLGLRVRECLAGGFDLLAFASPSAVLGFARAAGEHARGLPAVTIGPTTAHAAAEAGLDVRAVASPSTLEGLVSAAEKALAV